MKIIHTADLHIGKRVNECSMLDEQKYILGRIRDIVKDENADAIILAGDIYDKSVPSAEAISLFDDFLVSLARLGKSIFIISGNHDSAERIAFASRLMEKSKVYVSPVFNGTVEPIVLKDGDDKEVAFYLLPYIKPSMVQHFAGDEIEIKTYDEAVRYVTGKMTIDKSRSNILITHQFITDAERTESEDVVVGGLDNIDVSAFDAFDYVALGHLHRPQHCGRETVRYSGSPLKYSFSEVNDRKSVSVIEIDANGDVKVSERPIRGLHDWQDLRGTYEELTAKSYYDGKGYQEDFVRITLTDEDDIPDGMRKLKSIYHRLLVLLYDNKRTRAGITSVGKPMNVNKLKPDQLFGELFEKQNAQPMTQEQQEYLESIIDEIFNDRQQAE